MQDPTIGRIVRFRPTASRRDYPAIIVTTPHEAAGEMLEEGHVDLCVFMPFPTVEYNVPFDAAANDDPVRVPEQRSWRWPERVS